MREITRTVSRILHVFDPALPHSSTPAFYTDPTKYRLYISRKLLIRFVFSVAKLHTQPSSGQAYVFTFNFQALKYQSDKITNASNRLFRSRTAHGYTTLI